MRLSSRRFAICLFFSIFLSSSFARAAEIGTNDFRITNMGTDGTTGPSALNPAIAYNSRNNEYLVVFIGDPTNGTGETEIYGQRIDGTTGALLGTHDFRISHMGPDGN